MICCICSSASFLLKVGLTLRFVLFAWVCPDLGVSGTSTMDVSGWRTASNGSGSACVNGTSNEQETLDVCEFWDVSEYCDQPGCRSWGQFSRQSSRLVLVPDIRPSVLVPIPPSSKSSFCGLSVYGSVASSFSSFSSVVDWESIRDIRVAGC